MKKVYLRTVCTALVLSALTFAGPLYAAPADGATVQEGQKTSSQEDVKIQVDGDALMVAYDAAIAQGKSPEEAMVMAIQQVSAAVFSSAVASGYEGDTTALEASIATQVVAVMSVEISAKTGTSVAEAQSVVVTAYNESGAGPEVSATEVAASAAVVASEPAAESEVAPAEDANSADADDSNIVTESDLQATQDAVQEHVEAIDKEEESGSNI